MDFDGCVDDFEDPELKHVLIESIFTSLAISGELENDSESTSLAVAFKTGSTKLSSLFWLSKKLLIKFDGLLEI